MSFRTRLTLGISLLVTATGAALTLSAFLSARANTAMLADRLFREVTAHAVTQAQDHMLRVVPAARSLAVLQDKGLSLTNSNRLSEQLVRILRANPGVSWISYGNEDGAFTGAYRTPAGAIRINQSHLNDEGRTLMVEYDIGDDGQWSLYRHDTDIGYDPRKREFYRRAREAGKLVWLPPYIFYEQGIPGITCATPMYDANGTMLGVLTFDFDLNALSVFLSNLSISPNARVMLLTPEGVLVAHPKMRMRATPGQRGAGALPTVADADDPAALAFFEALRPSAAAAAAPAADERYRQFEFTSGGAGYYAGAQWFGVEDGPVWIVGAMAPKSDFLASVDRHRLMLLVISGAAVLGALLLAAALARRVSVPVVKLADAMHRIGSGDLETSADLGAGTEFRRLSTALNRMTTDLREGLRVRSAMAVARQVQQEMMPATASPPPAAPGLDIAAHNTCCDETGGDYYDCLPQPHGRGMLIAVGDVAGHGIGAALYMATARGILRSRAHDDDDGCGGGGGGSCGDGGGACECGGGTPARIVAHLNRVLSADMQSGRFMTLCLASIDPAQHTIRWVRAGHDPAIIYDPAASAFRELHGAGGLPLGVDAAALYEDGVYDALSPGQVVLLGTDGIWETRNPAGESFGKQRLHDAVRRSAAGSAAEISAAIQSDLASFRADAHQRDDVTFVIVKIIR